MICASRGIPRGSKIISDVGFHRKHRLAGRHLSTIIATLLFTTTSWAATSQVIHVFNSQDGDQPVTNLVFDSAGNLYGATAYGGNPACGPGCGVVFELSPQSGGGWKEKVLHYFNGTNGWGPFASPVFDASGNLYGSTAYGGNQSCQNGCGTVFELTRQGDGSWTKKVLHFFAGPDGVFPEGVLTLDSAGNLYATTASGGRNNVGVVFELMPQFDGTWKFQMLHSFSGIDGSYPQAGVIRDALGNLYGTTLSGGSSGNGVVFELSPTSGGGWTEKTLFDFSGADGAAPVANVIFDSAGNLYGTTQSGGNQLCENGCGTVFELSPGSGGSWTESVLYSFCVTDGCPDGSNPYSGLTMDSLKNLYGTTQTGGNQQCEFGCGTVYKLAPQASGGWAETVLLSFDVTNGFIPEAGITMGETRISATAKRSLYGAAAQGGPGDNDYGTVFEITP